MLNLGAQIGDKYHHSFSCFGLVKEAATVYFFPLIQILVSSFVAVLFFIVTGYRLLFSFARFLSVPWTVFFDCTWLQPHGAFPIQFSLFMKKKLNYLTKQFSCIIFLSKMRSLIYI